MRHESITHLLEEPIEAVEALPRQIATQTHIRRILENLNSLALDEGHALTILKQNVGRIEELERATLEDPVAFGEVCSTL